MQACGCNYRCVALNEYLSEVKCYCPPDWFMDESKDPAKCFRKLPLNRRRVS